MTANRDDYEERARGESITINIIDLWEYNTFNLNLKTIDTFNYSS